jgi:predicted acetyltransferase
VLRVIDWVALDPDAYSALVNYLIAHDLVTQVVMIASDDEPLLMAFEEPAHLKEPQSSWIGMLERLVDIEGAFRVRPCAPDAAGVSVTVEVNDDTAAWNSGTWHILGGEGCMAAERASASPQIVIPAVALGPLYSGFLSPGEARRVGLISVLDDRGFDELQRLLSVPYRPFCPDDF